MSRKNNGSILIITVFVFLFVNIIAINCSALILSNTRYTRYDYEEVYMKEQCLGKIELIYSNILKEVDKTLTNTNDYDSFKEYIVSDNFLNTINNIQDDDLNNTTYQINRTDLNDKNNSSNSVNRDNTKSVNNSRNYSNNNSNNNSSSSYNSGYIIPDSNVRYLSRSELYGYTKEQLAYIRNEIFARHGYVFEKAKYRNYFSAKSWYTPDYSFNYEYDLNSIEKANVDLIKELEK